MRHRILFFFLAFIGISQFVTSSDVRNKYNFNSDWLLYVGDVPEAKQPRFSDSEWKKVTLPHAFNEDEAFRLSIDELTDNQQSRITGVVVNVFQPQIRYVGTRFFKHFHGVAVRPKHADYHFEMHGKHRRNENGVVLFHFFREGNIVLFHFTAPFLQVRR